MIFTDYKTTDFDVQLGAKNTDAEKNRLKYVGYEDGGFDVVDFGSRSVDESAFELSAIPVNEYDGLLAYLLENVGREVPVNDNSDIFSFGVTDATDLNIYISDVTPKAETQFSDVGFYSIALKVRRPNELAVKRDFLVDIDLNAFSVDEVVPTPADLPTGTEGDTALVRNPRTLYKYTSGTWTEQFPLKPYEVTFYVDTLSDVLTRPKENDTAFTTITDEYFIFDGLEWVLTAFPSLSKWKPVVNNNPSIGLKNGVLRWTAFDTATYNGNEYVSGFIAENGIKFPTKSVPIDKGQGTEVLDGFKVNINNAERFSLNNVEFNFFGAVCTLSVYIDGVGVIKERTGLNKTNSFDSGFFGLAVEPFLWLDNDKNVLQNTLSQDGGNGKQGAPNLYGSWNYAPLVLQDNVTGFQTTPNGVSTFVVIDVKPFDGVLNTQKFTVSLPEAGFTFTTPDSENPSWYVNLNSLDRNLVPVSQVVSATPSTGAPFGTIELEVEALTTITDLRVGSTMRAVNLLVKYVVDLEVIKGIVEPIKVYAYDSDTDKYITIPRGLLEKTSDNTLQLVNDPEFVFLDGDNISFREYVSAKAVPLNDVPNTVNVGIIDGGGVEYSLPNNTSDTSPKALSIYDNGSGNVFGWNRWSHRGFSGTFNRFNFKLDDLGSYANTNTGYLLAANASFPNVAIFNASNVFGISNANASWGLAADWVTSFWWGRSDTNGCGVWSQAKNTPTSDIAVFNSEYLIHKGVNAATHLPTMETDKELGASFSWGITDEIKSKLVGATEVRFLTQFAIYGLGQSQDLANRGKIGSPNVRTGKADKYLSRFGYYYNVTCEMWLRHRDNPALDRLVSTNIFQTSSNANSTQKVFQTGTQIALEQWQVFENNNSFNKFSTAVSNTTTPLDQTKKFHQFCNIPKSLGGDDTFYLQDGERESESFWLTFTVVAEIGVDTFTIPANHGGKVSNVNLGIAGDIIDMALMDVDGNTYTSTSDIPHAIGATNIIANLLVLVLPTDSSTKTQWTTAITGLNGWRFSEFVGSDLVSEFKTNYDAYPEYSYSGRDLFKFDQTVVDELFSADNYLFDEYDRIDSVCYLWREEGLNDEQIRFVQIGAYDTNLLSIDGSARHNYNTESMGFFEASTDFEPSETYYVRADGRTDLNGKLINNPRTIAESQIQNVIPNFQLRYDAKSYSDRETWAARSFLQDTKTVKQVLDTLTEHTSSVVTYDDDGALRLRSTFIGDYNGFAKATFDKTNIEKKSKNLVKYRDITEMFTDFKFNFHYNTGKGAIDKTLRIKLSTSGNELEIQGLEQTSEDNSTTTEVKRELTQMLNGILLEDFQIAKTFYNTGRYNLFEGDYEQFYDNTLQVDNAATGIRAMASLASKWVRSNLLNAWEITFDTNMDYVLHSTNVDDDNRLRLGDPISFNLPSITGELTLYGLIRKIKPNYYNGKVSITVFSSVDPFTYATLYDRIWDGMDVDAEGYTKDDYRLKPLFKYPFKDTNQDYTFPTGDDTDSGTYDVNDYQFDNNSFADTEDPFEPFN